MSTSTLGHISYKLFRPKFTNFQYKRFQNSKTKSDKTTHLWTLNLPCVTPVHPPRHSSDAQVTAIPWSKCIHYSWSVKVFRYLFSKSGNRWLFCLTGEVKSSLVKDFKLIHSQPTKTSVKQVIFQGLSRPCKMADHFLHTSKDHRNPLGYSSFTSASTPHPGSKSSLLDLITHLITAFGDNISQDS